MAWTPGDFSKPKWVDWGRIGHKTFQMGFWPFVVVLISGAIYLLIRIWAWVLQ